MRGPARPRLWLALAVILLLSLVWARARRGTDEPRSAVTAPVVNDAAPRGTPAGAIVPRPSVADGLQDAARHRALGALPPAELWRKQVAAALQPLAARLGRPLAPAAQARLIDALAAVRPAAQGLDRDTLDPDDPASIARVREQTAALLAADEVCRDELGIGVAELIHALGPDQVEDQGAAPPPGG